MPDIVDYSPSMEKAEIRGIPTGWQLIYVNIITIGQDRLLAVFRETIAESSISGPTRARKYHFVEIPLQ